MTAEDRINAVAAFGFTRRQARFLVTVMQHSGVCVLRQYTAFAGIVHGQKTWAFFDKLVQCRYAIPHRCRHHRGRIYHVRYKPLYRAIGDTDSRYRRSMSAAQVIDCLATLDAVLASPNVTWLTTAEDRQRHLAGVASQGALNEGPVGVDSDGCIVFLFLVSKGRLDEFRAFLQQRGALISTLPAWTVRVVLSTQLSWLSKQYEEVFRQELAQPIPDLVNQLRWYFKQRQTAATGATAVQDEERYFEAKFAFGAPRFQVLYRRWLREGEVAFDVVSSRAIADAITSGAGRLECHALPFSYRHLSPLVGQAHRARKGDEAGEDCRSRPRPRVGSVDRLLIDGPESVLTADASASEGIAPWALAARCAHNGQPGRAAFFAARLTVANREQRRNQDVSDPGVRSRT